MKKLLSILLLAVSITALGQPFIPFRAPVRVVYQGDTLEWYKQSTNQRFRSNKAFISTAPSFSFIGPSGFTGNMGVTGTATITGSLSYVGTFGGSGNWLLRGRNDLGVASNAADTIKSESVDVGRTPITLISRAWLDGTTHEWTFQDPVLGTKKLSELGGSSLGNGFLKARGDSTFVPYASLAELGSFNEGVYFGTTDPTRTTRVNINASVRATVFRSGTGTSSYGQLNNGVLGVTDVASASAVTGLAYGTNGRGGWFSGTLGVGVLGESTSSFGGDFVSTTGIPLRVYQPTVGAGNLKLATFVRRESEKLYIDTFGRSRAAVTGDYMINDTSVLYVPAIKVHRTTNINTTTTNWTNIKWSEVAPTGTTYGFILAGDSTYILTRKTGMYLTGGCTRFVWNGGAGTVTGGTRVTVNSVEQRCSQAPFKFAGPTNADIFSTPFTGSIKVVPGDTIRMQYKVSDTDMDIEALSGFFDSDAPSTLRIEWISRP